LQAKDHKSLFMSWLAEHGSSVVKVARTYTVTSADGQGLTQEILLQTWRSLPKFQRTASAATWFYRVALHAAMNRRRDPRHPHYLERSSRNGMTLIGLRPPPARLTVSHSRLTVGPHQPSARKSLRGKRLADLRGHS
jgi:DNA-directed RNA polymerase specialized sigma24 family protein